MSLLLTPTPTVRQVLEAVFQLVIGNAPGSAIPPGQRAQIAASAETLFERFVEGRIREALAKHIAAEGETFDARVDRRIDVRLTDIAKTLTTLQDAAALASVPDGFIRRWSLTSGDADNGD